MSLAVVAQVHGNTVLEASEAGESPVFTVGEADALVTTRPGVGLAIRVADCVPVLFADAHAGVIGAAHAGRRGLLSGVLGATVAAMRARGASDVEAWVGPHICGSCYEVPADMAQDAAAQLQIPVATTSWGTPAIDQTAATLAQLERAGVRVNAVGACTREDVSLPSYRRDHGACGRLAGIVWLAARRGSEVDPAR